MREQDLIYKAFIDGHGAIDIKKSDLDQVAITYDPNGQPSSVIYMNKHYDVTVIDSEEGSTAILIDGIEMRVLLKRPVDLLVEELGLSKAKKNTISEVKAPMPGHVLDIHVSRGQTVAEGEALLTLEAMKMENTVKTNAAGVVEDIYVRVGETVSKGDLLFRLV